MNKKYKKIIKNNKKINYIKLKNLMKINLKNLFLN